MKEIKIHTDYILLQNVLKLADIISTGGEAKVYLIDHDVYVNSVLENRRGRKLYPGDEVGIQNEIYKIVKDVDK